MAEYRYPKTLPWLVRILGVAFLIAAAYSNWTRSINIWANVICCVLPIAALFILAVHVRKFAVYTFEDGFIVKSWKSVSYRFADIKSISSDSGKVVAATVVMTDGTKVGFNSSIPDFKLLISAIRAGAAIPKKAWEPV